VGKHPRLPLDGSVSLGAVHRADPTGYVRILEARPRVVPQFGLILELSPPLPIRRVCLSTHGLNCAPSNEGNLSPRVLLHASRSSTENFAS
jgi:hypothetical protein